MRTKPSADDVERAATSAQLWQSFLKANSYSLSEIDFTGLYFQDLDFSETDLEACIFHDSYIKGCDFSRTNLYGADFTRANVFDCNFTGALLSSANFSDSEVAGCSFQLAELSQVSANDASFDDCDISRARGVSQEFLDKSVGTGSVIIPQSLDYPAHWARSNDDRAADILLTQLRAFRGDEVLLCTFDGQRLIAEQVASRVKPEVESTLRFLQRQLGLLVEEKFLHNEAPKVYRSLADYYEVITQNAGEGQPRWPRKVYEVDEIHLGLQGNCLSAYVEAARREILQNAAEKIPVIDQIVASHFLLSSGLSRWRSFLDSAIDAKLSEQEVASVEKYSEILYERVKDKEIFDPEIPRTVRALRLLFGRPKEALRLAVFGIVRCVESMFSAIFTFCRQFIVSSAKLLIDEGSKVAVRATLAALVGLGSVSMLSQFPHLSTWVAGGISALRTMAIIP